MKDCGFPLIAYQENHSPRQWGQHHGEQWREAIKELAHIRRELMLARSPALACQIEDLAQAQWQAGRKFAPALGEELQGIAEASRCSLAELIVLNNYTDFRDLKASSQNVSQDEGCSTVQINHEGASLAGQTWDMHRSAKNFVCLIDLPPSEGHPGALVFSLVGCVGMMGVNSAGHLAGVNNLNTRGARPGIPWPFLIRVLLWQRERHQSRHVLQNAQVTSGHNYLIADKGGGEHWELAPGVFSLASKSEGPHNNYSFHTNHCLTPGAASLEDSASLASTTRDRYELLEKKIPGVFSFEQLKALLSDHEQYPRSICGHFESGALDPSATCGGGIADLSNGRGLFWRGCMVHDRDYRERVFKLEGERFIQQ